jgi:hypothetical protein
MHILKYKQYKMNCKSNLKSNIFNKFRGTTVEMDKTKCDEVGTKIANIRNFKNLDGTGIESGSLMKFYGKVKRTFLRSAFFIFLNMRTLAVIYVCVYIIKSDKKVVKSCQNFLKNRFFIKCSNYVDSIDVDELAEALNEIEEKNPNLIQNLNQNDKVFI